MEQVDFWVNEAFTEKLRNLYNVPFAKTDNGYVFAYWVYDMNNTEESQRRISECEGGKEAGEFFERTIELLKEIIISEDDYIGWKIHRKNAGGVLKYHKIMKDLSMNLIIQVMKDYDVDKVKNFDHKTESDWYHTKSDSSSDVTKYVLNRQNPFADVSIKSQQFFYKTADGGTETLFFNTNNIVEKIEKNGKNMFTMRPGFSVTKEHGVVQKPMQKITFSNSITEPIVSNENHIYVHID